MTRPTDPASGRLEMTYVLPLRVAVDAPAQERAELAGYVWALTEWCAEVIIVDGSEPLVRAGHRRDWPPAVRHVVPDPRHSALMGKVPGVLTGLDLAGHEAVVIADDDVRYGPRELARVCELLGEHDLVRPQNYFDPLPWHAVWDTARSLLNRSLGADFPGTLGVRRSRLRHTGGYDGNVLFENLELMRTVRADGGTIASPPDLYVIRRPPSTRHFIGQRTRQAYDDFAIPARMALWLSILPGLALAASRGRAPLVRTLGTGAISASVMAEAGRRRGGGRQVFPVAASALAGPWCLERAVCAWLAVLQRVRYGGVRYGDSVIRISAHSSRQLRQRATTRNSASDSSAAPSTMPPAVATLSR